MHKEVESFETINFYNLKEAVDNEISQQRHVPASIRFTDKHGIVSSSRAMLVDAVNKKPSIFTKAEYNSQLKNS